jgi:hypothetical protein
MCKNNWKEERLILQKEQCQILITNLEQITVIQQVLQDENKAYMYHLAVFYTDYFVGTPHLMPEF